MSHREKVLVTILVILAVGTGAYFAYGYWQKQNTTTNTTPTTTTTTSTSTKTATPTTTKTTEITPTADVGVTWLAAPKVLDDLKLFKDGSDCSDVKYFKTADLTGGDELDMATATCGMGQTEFFRFKKVGSTDKSAPYKYLAKISDLGTADLGNNMFDETKVETDNTITYISLSNPDTIVTGKGVTLNAKSFGSSTFYSDLVSPEKIDSSNYGYIYSVQSATDATGVFSRIIYLKHADATVSFYSYKNPFMTDDGVLGFTLTDGTVNKGQYQTSIIYGKCGSLMGNTVLTTLTAADLDKYGKATNGDTVYIPKSSNNPVYDLAYATYKVGRDTDAMTKADFVKQHPVVLWQDLYGVYQAYLDNTFVPMAECGKPVIYLYPTKETNVSVNVDVKMTKSEPDYGKGWNVVADPSGKITAAGKIYDYLFWEGRGQTYPTINSGAVVETKNVQKTLINQMTQLGLNEKERSDFLAFWLPKMPTTPYVRLTWIGTQDMNKLAPLSITPKPDTIIRIFLDFEGLAQPISLPAQKLSAPARNGFTVVEWGGLLVGRN